MNLRRLPALVAALFLQVAPLVRTVEPLAASVLQPLAILFRWAASAATLAGSLHALSGATGFISSTTVEGTQGKPLSYRAQIISDEYGAPKSYSATRLPPGLNITRTGPLAGTISGIPTTAGDFDTRVTGWENSNNTGNSYTGTVRFLIAASGPTITTDPLSQTVTEGARVTLTVVASGTDLTYRWIKDSVELPGGTNDVLVLDPVRLEDDGTYTVRVQNTGGFTVSNPAVLTVTPAPKPPQITTQPLGGTFSEGSALTLSVVVSGDPPFSYQWFLGTNPVPNAISEQLTLDPLRTSDAGTYTVRVENAAGPAVSEPAIVVVNPAVAPPSITSQPLGGTFTEGSALTLSVAVSGDPPFSYQWFLGTDPVPNATSEQLTLDPLRTSDAGTYTVRVENAAGPAVSEPAIVVVNPAVAPPSITSLTGDLTRHAGEPVRLEVVATSTGTPQYVWRTGGAPIPGADGPVLDLPPSDAVGIHEYEVVVSASGLSVTSAPVRVTMVGSLVALPPVPGPDSLRIPFSAIPGRLYRLESNPGLDPAGWSPVTEVVAQSPTAELSAPTTGGPALLLRLRVMEPPAP